MNSPISSARGISGEGWAAIAGAIGRLDLAGSVGIDFPGLGDKAARQGVDAALDGALARIGWRGERTAMNGFGFVHLLNAPSAVKFGSYIP